jgi:hypothetical protein
MFGIFARMNGGMDWLCNVDTLEEATAACEDYRSRDDIDWLFVLPVAHFIDVDGERESPAIDEAADEPQ